MALGRFCKSHSSITRIAVCDDFSHLEKAKRALKAAEPYAAPHSEENVKHFTGTERVPLFLGEAALHKAGIPRVTWCPVADWKVEDWPARTGAAESRTPTPTRTPTSPVATKPHSL